jgi:di/tricarboxylate transporter
MSWESWITLLVIGATVVVLVRDLLAPSLTILGATVLLMLVGVISPRQAFSGFSNPAPITVAALYVLARAVVKTGALQGVVDRLMGKGEVGRWGLAKLLVPVAGVSAFLNNTPVVAMMTPQVTEWADRNGQSPSRYLMPLSFATLLGGVMTVIGTSTNIVMSGLLESSGYEPIAMFEITRIGFPLAIVGLGLIVLLAPKVLPERRPPRQQAQDDIREFVVNMVVEPGGAIDGKAVEDVGLRNLQGVFLVEVQRHNELIAPVGPDMVLIGGDRLTFVGKADLVVDLHHMKGLVSTEEQHMLVFDAPHHTFFESVVGAASPLVGKTLKEIEFRGTYQAAVIAIHRAGQRVKEKLGDVRLHVGDTLLLLADPDFAERWHDRNDFLLVSQLGGSHPSVTRKAVHVACIAVGVIIAVALGLLPMIKAALIGVVAVLALKVLTADEARRAIDVDTIIVIAAAFGLGAAVQTSGLAEHIAGVVVGVFSGLGTMGPLLGIVVSTVVLTEVITHNAAAVLVFPIAVATAASMGLNPRPFALAVTVAASLSFLTPIGYQTNTMVYGPGGYRYGDYARLGLPLTLLMIIAIVVLVPLAWGL